MKTYILQKHLPNLNAGSELTLSCDREHYEIENDDTGHYFSFFKEVVENNPDWFKEKVVELPEGLVIDVSGTSKEEVDELLRLWLKLKPKVLQGDRKYTLHDLKRTWNASRGIGLFFETFDSFSHYLNTTTNE